jgi:hypothetical protein
VVIVPLSRALAEVSREVRARAAVNRLVNAEPLLADALQIDQRVDRGALQLRAVVVGSDEQAADLERRLALDLASATGTRPLVHVRAVPQAGVLSRAAQPATLQAEPIDLVSPRQAAEKLTRDVRASLDRHLPAAAGVVLESRIEIAGDGDVALILALAERGFDSGATAILARAIAGDLGTAVRVQSVGLPVEPRTAIVREHETWLAAVTEPLLVARSLSSVSACVTVPEETALRRLPAARRTRDTVLGWLAALPPARVGVRSAQAWSLRFAQETCAEPATASEAAPAPPAASR